MYHKPCLSCKSCSKRLDSFSLVEHDSEPYCKQCHIRNFSTKDLRHANLPQASPPTSPSRTPTGSAPTSPSRATIPTSPGKLNLATLASPKRDLEQDTPLEPPPQPFSFPPVDIPEPIPEEKEEPEVVPQEPKPVVEAVAKSPSPPPKRFSIYSRRPMSPVYSPDQLASTSSQPQPPATATATTFSDIGRPAIGSPRSSWQPPPKPSTPEIKEGEAGTAPQNGPASTSMGMSVSEPPQSAPPTTTTFLKRIVPMATGGGIVPIPGPYSPTKRLTQTFTGSGAPISTSQPLSPNFTGRGAGSPITPNFTGQGVFGAPKKLTPNFTGGVWSGGNKDQCPKCGKAVYHAEGLYGPQGSGYALLGKVG
ncbi:hypothetical protein FRC01_005486 [Tulasnella sp. 417]|nr:hypothetical protein FRC01_005486 [Tulasnella sp. 417]